MRCRRRGFGTLRCRMAPVRCLFRVRRRPWRAVEGQAQLVLPRATGRHRNFDPPDADAHQRTKFQQPQRIVPQVASAN